MSDRTPPSDARDTTPGLMRRWVLRIAFGLFALVLLIGIIGSQMAPGYSSSTEGAFPTLTPEALWALLEDYDRFPMTSGPSLGVTRHRPPSNGLPTWEERIRGAVIVVTTDEATRPSKLVRTLTDLDSPMVTQWTFEITPEGSGSRLTIREEGQIPGGSWVSPWLRIMVRVSPGYGIRDLVRRLQESSE